MAENTPDLKNTTPEGMPAATPGSTPEASQARKKVGAGLIRSIRRGIGEGGRLDAWLWQRGLHAAPIRLILRIQASVAGLGLVIGITALPWTSWGIWFALSACLAAWIFYALSQSVQRIIQIGWSKDTFLRLWVRTMGRLLFVGVFLYLALVWFNAPVSALIAGLSMLVAPLPASCIDRKQ